MLLKILIFLCTVATAHGSRIRLSKVCASEEIDMSCPEGRLDITNIGVQMDIKERASTCSTRTESFCFLFIGKNLEEEMISPGVLNLRNFIYQSCFNKTSCVIQLPQPKDVRFTTEFSQHVFSVCAMDEDEYLSSVSINALCKDPSEIDPVEFGKFIRFESSEVALTEPTTVATTLPEESTETPKRLLVPPQPAKYEETNGIDSTTESMTVIDTTPQPVVLTVDERLRLALENNKGRRVRSCRIVLDNGRITRKSLNIMRQNCLFSRTQRGRNRGASNDQARY